MVQLVSNGAALSGTPPGGPAGETNWMAQHGARLIDNGFAIIPIMPHDKKPGRMAGQHWMPLVDWTRFGSQPATDFHAGMWARWPGCGIGIVCGKIVAVDLDVLDGELSIKLEKLAFRMLGQTPAVRIGMAPKRLLVYRTKTPFPKIKAAPIEVLCDGQQFVAYGIHPKTNAPYQWPIEHLADIDANDLPLVDEEKTRAFVVEALKIIPAELRVSRLGPDMHDEQSKLSYGDLEGTVDAVASALDYIVNLDLHYDDWVRIGMAIKGALGEEGRHLWLAWSATSKKDEPASSTKAWASFKPSSIGAGSIYWLAEQNGWRPGLQPRLVLNGHAAATQAAVNGADIAAGLSRQPKAATLPVEAPRQETPAFVEASPGLLGDLVRWMVGTAIYPQPELAMAAAICAIGTAAGRRYAGPLDIRSNVYCVGVAESGAGKEHQLGCLSRLFLAADLADHFAGEDIGSGSAVDSTISLRATQLFQIDEIGHFLQSLLNPRNTSSHKRDILTKLTKYTGAATRLVKGTEYANKKERERVDVHQPCVCVYGTTVPGPLWQAFGSGAMKDGSIARMLFFQATNNYPDIQRIPPGMDRAPPRALVDGVRRIVARDAADSDLGFQAARGQALDAKVQPLLWQVEHDDGARALMDALEVEQVGIKRRHEKTGYAALWARWLEHVSRLSLIAAIARDQMAPAISADDLKWARSVVDHCLQTIVAAAEEFIADNENERLGKAILSIIRKAGQGGLAAFELTKKTQHISRRLRGDLIADLEESGSIIVVTEPAPGRGRGKTTYHAV